MTVVFHRRYFLKINELWGTGTGPQQPLVLNSISAANFSSLKEPIDLMMEVECGLKK